MSYLGVIQVTQTVFVAKLNYRSGIGIRTKNNYLEPVRNFLEIIWAVFNLFRFILIYFTCVLIKESNFAKIIHN
jgi:hypothetical protein